MSVVEFLKWSRIHYVVFGILFLTSGLIINFMQFLLYILLRPLNKNLFRIVNYYLSYSLFSQLVFLEQYWAGMKITLHAKKSDYVDFFGKEHALLLMNHTYEIDWLIGWVLGENRGVLGNCKAYAKKALQYLPTLGFAWKFGENIFLERDWNKDQSTVEKNIKELIAYKQPFWLLLTAEGTRFTKEKHEASKAFAKEHGLPILRHHLTPRTRGFIVSLPHLRKKVPAIYNVNIGVKPNGISPTVSNILLGKPITAGLFIERFPMNELPEDEKDLATWLHNLYKRKDDLLNSYIETGNWFATSNVEKCDEFVLPRRIFPALNLALWALLILIPLGYFTVKLLLSGNAVYLATAVTVFSFFAVIFNKLLEETKISKGSSYGVSKDTATIEAQHKN